MHLMLRLGVRVWVQLHALGLRWGSRVVQQCVRMLPFWQAWFTHHPNQSEPFSKVRLPACCRKTFNLLLRQYSALHDHRPSLPLARHVEHQAHCGLVASHGHA